MAHQRALCRPSGHEVLLAVVLAGPKTAPPLLVRLLLHAITVGLCCVHRGRASGAPHRPTHAHAGRRRVRCRGGVGGGRRRRRLAWLVRWRTSWYGRYPPPPSPARLVPLWPFFSRLFFFFLHLLFSLFLPGISSVSPFSVLVSLLLRLWRACSGACRCPRRPAAAARRSSPPHGLSGFLFAPSPIPTPFRGHPSFRGRHGFGHPPPPAPPNQACRHRLTSRGGAQPCRRVGRRRLCGRRDHVGGAGAGGCCRRPPATVLVERAARRCRRRRGCQGPRSLLHPAPRAIIERRGRRVGPPPIVDWRRRRQPPPPPAACAQRPFPAAVVAPAGDPPLQAGAQ